MEIDTHLAQELVASQFPEWAQLPIERVRLNGWDNRTFRLGDELSVRLPSAAAYEAQVEKEHRWLPLLGPHLPLRIPTPVAMGKPGCGYPWRWSIYRWIEGENAAVARIQDRSELATALGAFLTALQRLDPSGGPAPGAHNFLRGGPLRTYDAETRRSLAVLGGRLDTSALLKVWEAALDARWSGPPVWVHGDVSGANLLVAQERLSAVIDFGCSGVGDPACDLTIAWTFLSGPSRAAFRTAVPADPGTWARARGWALWKALITLAPLEAEAPAGRAAQRVVDDVLAEHRGVA